MTYAVDDGHGNQLTAGLQPHNARRVARRIANERGESVWLYGDNDRITTQPVEIVPTVVRS